jgi:hypothetical protein
MRVVERFHGTAAKCLRPLAPGAARAYVTGDRYLPDAISRMRKNPRVLLCLSRDMVASHGADSQVHFKLELVQK